MKRKKQRVTKQQEVSWRINMNIEMREWNSHFIPDYEFVDKQAKEIATMLTKRGIIEISELKNGLLVTTNSYVGRISLGELDIKITPKLNGMELFTLMQYAYSLKDLKLFDEISSNLESFSFFDILIYQLYLYIEDLFVKGFHRGYVRRHDELPALRGRLDINRLSRSLPMQKTALPCTYYERNEDNVLNQVLLAGICLSIRLVADQQIKLQLQRLCTYLSESISSVSLNGQLLKKAKTSINRLTERYRPLLEIITILYESQGMEFKDSDKVIQLKGFLFDMNRFFESLVEKLIKDFVPDYSLREQFQLNEMFSYEAGFNPRRRRSPTPRPDFALMTGNKVVKLMDAKYKDLWEATLPRDMLYQLAIYALSSEGDQTSVIIYPSSNDLATTQKIVINDPTNNDKMGTVLLKSLNLNKVAVWLRDVSKNRRDLVRYIDKVLFVD